MKTGHLSFDTEEDVKQISNSTGLSTSNQNYDSGGSVAIATTDSVPSISPRIKFEGSDASRDALELEELLTSLGIGPVAVTDVPNAGVDGYYWASSVTRNLRVPDENDEVATVDVTLELAGRRASDVRAIETAPTDDVDHEFGNDLEAPVALPTSAQLVEWYDPESRTTEPATAFETVETARGPLELYDTYNDSSFETPTLAADIPYEDDDVLDVYVRDSYDGDVDAAAGWRVLTARGHDPRDPIAFETGRVLLVADQNEGTLRAEEYDPVVDVWLDLDLTQPDDAELACCTLVEIGPTRTTARLVFDVADDPDTHHDLYAVKMIVHTGWDRIQFAVADGEDPPIPDSIEDWLEPVASERLSDPRSSKTLLSRSKICR